MADNAAAYAALDRQIALLKKLPAQLQTEAGQIAIGVLDRSLSTTIAAGQAPDGTPWQRTKEGTAPLKNARKALKFSRVGTGVLVQLQGPEALHHLGRAKGEIVRRIIPVGVLPGKIVSALRAAYVARFNQLVVK